jgi:hypothetical protein
VNAAAAPLPAVRFHRRYLSLVEAIERRFPVTQWCAADLEVWPLARMDLYQDLFRASVGIASAPRRSLPARVLQRYATPLVNVWRSREDLRHWVARPKPAHSIFLGDGVSLDWVDGAWQDRYGEPLMAALGRRGRDTFLMQPGDLSRLPWHRPTFAANRVAVRGARRRTSVTACPSLPGLQQVSQFLAAEGIDAPSLTQTALTARARLLLATAAAFEQVLDIVQPTLAFVVTYYADLGPAFMLACRRRGVLSIDLQHCPHEGAHKAYGWWALPPSGYAVLPAVFWHWTQADATHTQSWASRLALPWHRSVHGGHVQLTPYLDDRDPNTLRLDRRFDTLTDGVRYPREILVALQPVSGYRAQWDALATQIEASPPEWRWWIRRHPASRAYQDDEYRRLIELRRPNVIIDGASLLPLPVLLRHIHVLVSRFSGASAEAADFGVPSLFLSDEARGQFGGLIERGIARVVDIAQIHAHIAQLPLLTQRPSLASPPELDSTLSLLEAVAPDYRIQCQDQSAMRRTRLESRNSSR